MKTKRKHPNCPDCKSEKVVKNGSIHNGKQKYQCNECGRQFVKAPKNKRVTDEQKELIDKLLLEKIPLAGIARVVEVSEKWLQSYVNNKYDNVPQKIEPKPKKKSV